MANITDDVAVFLWRGDNPPWVEVIVQVFLWFLSIITVFGNTLVLVVFAQDEHLRSKMSNIFILNLALADLLVGCISIPFYNLYRSVGLWRFGEAVCKFWMIMDFTECYVSVWAVVLISYDRYMLVTKGLEYDKLQTLRKCVTISILLWLIHIVRYACLFVGYDLFVTSWVDYGEHCDGAVLYIPGFFIFELAMCNVIPIILVLIFSIILYSDILKRSRRRLASNQVEPESSINTVATSVDGDNIGPTSKDNVPPAPAEVKVRQGTTNLRKHRRAAVTLTLIVAVSSVCWLPYFSTIFLSVIFEISATTRTRIVACYIFYANSAINPLLYVATNPRIRNGIAKLLRMK